MAAPPSSPLLATRRLLNRELLEFPPRTERGEGGGGGKFIALYVVAVEKTPRFNTAYRRQEATSF